MGVEYFGARFKGWQRQSSAKPSVQEEIELALSHIANTDIQIVCAGRTDAGVHATRQIIHFDSPVFRSENSWIRGTNTQLPDDIAVKWVKPVSEDFHARFSATARRYRYVIINTASAPAIHRQGLTWQFKPLDETLMHQAGQYLLGEQDFTSFRASECQSHTAMRNIHHIQVKRFGELVVIDVKANAFLHHMIRNIAGTLMDVGMGRKPVSWVKDVLAAKDRSKAGITAPPNGLYFVDVDYPDVFGIPDESLGPLMLSAVNEQLELGLQGNSL